uniref:SFRICE_005521 n=1 Tax=Spodoptera frugiperda TaxID=7108 RepID=A0A2H1W4I5_SPOFR
MYYMHCHVFYPRRGRQRCTLRHVMPLYNVHTLFTICVISPMRPPYHKVGPVVKSIPRSTGSIAFLSRAAVAEGFIVDRLYTVTVSFMLFVQPFRFERCPE